MQLQQQLQSQQEQLRKQQEQQIHAMQQKQQSMMQNAMSQVSPYHPISLLMYRYTRYKSIFILQDNTCNVCKTPRKTTIVLLRLFGIEE